MNKNELVARLNNWRSKSFIPANSYNVGYQDALDAVISLIENRLEESAVEYSEIKKELKITKEIVSIRDSELKTAFQESAALRKENTALGDRISDSIMLGASYLEDKKKLEEENNLLKKYINKVDAEDIRKAEQIDFLGKVWNVSVGKVVTLNKEIEKLSGDGIYLQGRLESSEKTKQALTSQIVDLGKQLNKLNSMTFLELLTKFGASLQWDGGSKYTATLKQTAPLETWKGDSYWQSLNEDNTYYGY